MQVDDTLVDPHLELVPGLGTLTCQLSIVKHHSSYTREMFYQTMEVWQSAIKGLIKNHGIGSDF